MGRLEREELRAVVLNAKNVVLRVVTVYQGNVSSSLVRIGELFRDAVRLNASRRDPRPQPPVGRPDAIAGRPAPHGRGARRRAGCSTSTCSTTWSSAMTRGCRCAIAASRSTGPPGCGTRSRRGPGRSPRVGPNLYWRPAPAAPARLLEGPLLHIEDVPPACSTAFSACSPATSASTWGRPTRSSTSASAASSSASRASSRSTPRPGACWRSAPRRSAWSAGRRRTSSRSGPLRDGVISDFDVTEQMIKYFVDKVHSFTRRDLAAADAARHPVGRDRGREAGRARRGAQLRCALGAPDRGADGRRDRRRACRSASRPARWSSTSAAARPRSR